MKPNETFSPDPDLLSLESRLARTLKPVTPSSDIVHRLRGRIQLQIPSRQEIKLRLSDWRRLFVVFGGVMSGMLVLLTIARAFYYLSGRRS